MESRQNLKARIRAVGSVKEIAKAMEVVAATKMRKSQEAALRTRPYAWAALAFLEKLSRHSALSHPLAEKRARGKMLLIPIASDRGFAGKFNAEVLARLEERLKENPGAEVLAVGKKVEVYLRRKKIRPVKVFYGFGDFVSPEEIEPLSDFVVSGFEKKFWDQVAVVSAHFRTALRQEVLSRRILPLDLEAVRGTIRKIIPESGRYSEIRNDWEEGDKARREIDYIFEPDASQTLAVLLPHLLKMQLYHIVLEANASEHSARRVAMKNASDNASDLSETLTISYNKARQAGITTELAEITGAQSALS